MQIKILSIFLFAFFSKNVLANNDLCLALTNYDINSVTLRSMGGPGYPYIAETSQTITLSSDEMGWACPNDGICSVSVRDNVTGSVTNIYHVKRGSHIIFSTKDEYYVDQNAGVLCIE